jgi:hypothetical protein
MKQVVLVLAIFALSNTSAADQRSNNPELTCEGSNRFETVAVKVYSRSHPFPLEVYRGNNEASLDLFRRYSWQDSKITRLRTMTVYEGFGGGTHTAHWEMELKVLDESDSRGARLGILNHSRLNSTRGITVYCR